MEPSPRPRRETAPPTLAIAGREIVSSQGPCSRELRLRMGSVTRKEALLDACVAYGRKSPPTFATSPARLERILLALASADIDNSRIFAPQITAFARRKTAAGARRHTQQKGNLEGRVAACAHANDAREPHTSPAVAAATQTRQQKRVNPLKLHRPPSTDSHRKPRRPSTRSRYYTTSTIRR